MGLSESRIELQGAAVINQSVGIFPLIETLIALRQEFLRISIATREQQHRKENESRRCPSGLAAAPKERRLGSADVVMAIGKCNSAPSCQF